MELSEPSGSATSLGDTAQVVARVLLVDDQPMIGEAIRRVLANEHDIEFHYHANSIDAVAVAARLEPTVILQDLVMPDVDGLTLLRHYREEPRTRSIPIIVLSSKEDARVKRDAFTAGADDYLVKLPDDVELIARVRHHSRAHLTQIQRDAAYRQLGASRQQLVISNAELESALKERMLAQLALQQRNAELIELNHQLSDTQQQLLQSEKMASVGQLAAGVAHEINNPIGFVGSNLSSLKTYLHDLFRLLEAYEHLEASVPVTNPHLSKLATLKQSLQLSFVREDTVTLLAECVEGIERIARIVQDLKNFSHVDRADWQRVNVHDAIESSLNVVQHELRQRAGIVKQFGDLPQIECLPFQLNQVFLNLLINAYQAIDKRGTIAIRTERDGARIRVHITDSGKGIPKDELARIFEPFYTTKPIGTGPGLGLSSAYSIVRHHGGSIDVTSTVGKGSTFTVNLPIERASATSAAS
jgi:two-component system NtrC family sensor kinase